MVNQADHDSEYMICKCEHDTNDHSYIPNELDNDDLDCDKCKCKKFESKNHSQQETSKKSDFVKPADTSTLSDFRQRSQDVWSYEEENVKESIKRLFKVVDNEIGLETTKGRRIVNGFNRELGDKLT